MEVFGATNAAGTGKNLADAAGIMSGYIKYRADQFDTMKTDVQNIKEMYGQDSVYYENYKHSHTKIAAEAANQEGKRAAEKLEQIFNNIRNSIRDYINAPIPQDFVTTINLYNSVGYKPTPEEVNAMIDKYGQNYGARQVIRSLIAGENPTGKYLEAFNMLSLAHDAAQVMQEVESVRSSALDYINGRGRNEYNKALWLNEECNPIKSLDQNLNAFLAGF